MELYAYFHMHVYVHTIYDRVVHRDSFSLLSFKPINTIELLTVATVSDMADVAFKPVTWCFEGNELCNHGLGHESQSSDGAPTTYGITQSH